MADFAISLLADPASCYASFPPSGHRIAGDARGNTYFSLQSRNGAVSNGQPNDYAILRDSGAGGVPFWSAANLPTNMLLLEAFSTGELFAFYADYVSGVLHVLFWADPLSSAAPVDAVLSGAGCASNFKLGSVASETDRCLYLIGSGGYFFRISETGTELGRQALFITTGSDAPVYFWPKIDRDGRLYLGIQNAFSLTPGNPDYDAATYLMSPNPQDCGNTIGAGFLAGVWGIAHTLTLPLDAGWNGPANQGILGAENRGGDNYMIGCAVDQGIVYQLVCESPGQGTKPFDHDDLRHCSAMVSAMPWPPSRSSPSTRTHRPLRDGEVFMRAGSGAIEVRQSGIRAIGHDREALLSFVSTDQGESWQLEARTLVPGIGAAGMIHYLNVKNGDIGDATIEGVFTRSACTPSQWATSSCPVPPAYAPDNPTATALRFSLVVS